MLWDVFCRVIDNFGDIGVCWRLCADLASRGHTARLWVDDTSALAWMAPRLTWNQTQHGLATTRPWRVGTCTVGLGVLEVHDWAEAQAPSVVLTPGEVVIESFGCNPPDAFVARMQRTQPPAWINLEYLSAEAYVERSHGLASPVFSGPGAGLSKRFFYPGFTPATGGLLREPNLMARQANFLATRRLSWLHTLGVPVAPADRLVSVFCYAHAPLGDWLDALQDDALHAQPGSITRLLLTHGHASQLAKTWVAQGRHTAPQHMQLHCLPALPQTDFDHLLWACHLNIVRGEDSATRALWAGRPHAWHIYPQDDGVHARKLDAFMDRWMSTWPHDLRNDVQQAWRHLNGLGASVAPTLPPGASSLPLRSLPDWRNEEGAWAQASREARAALLTQTDLVTQLTQFVTGSG